MESRTTMLVSAIEAALDRVTRTLDCPALLQQSIRYSLLGGGKRIRPLLVLLACEACGGEIAEAMPAACAVEMIHSYSLIHDDLPAMDDDDLRRGKATNHKKFGEGQAILAGDGLLTLAFDILSSEITDPAIALACIATLAKAAGIEGMVGGQSDDLSMELKAGSLPMLQSIHQRKTGALIKASLKLGAIIAKATKRQFNVLREYGSLLGMLFQITDDLLDATGDQQKAGKKVGKDRKKGKMTYPGLIGIEESRVLATKIAGEAIEALEVFGKRGEALRSIVESLHKRDR